MKGGIKYKMCFIFQRDIVPNFIIILKLIPCAVLSLDYISSTLEDPGEVIPRPQGGPEVPASSNEIEGQSVGALTAPGSPRVNWPQQWDTIN